MTYSANDARFYSGDSASPGGSQNGDLTSRVPYDGRRATSPDTGNRYLNHVGIIDNTDNTQPTSPGAHTDCDWITTKFNGNKNGKYEVTIKDGNIYVTSEDGQQRLTEPQAFHPAARDERDRRDSNYYNNAPRTNYDGYDESQNDPRFRPRQDFIPPPPPRDYGYGYGEQNRGPLNVGGLFLGAALGALFGGHRHAYSGYEGYRPPMIGYVPSGFSPVTYGGNTYDNGYSGGYSGYSGNQNYFRPRPTPRYAYAGPTYGVNPQYTSGDYPGNTYYDS